MSNWAKIKLFCLANARFGFELFVFFGSWSCPTRNPSDNIDANFELKSFYGFQMSLSIVTDVDDFLAIFVININVISVCQNQAFFPLEYEVPEL